MKTHFLLSALVLVSLCASKASAKDCSAYPFSETPFPASGRCTPPKEKCTTKESKGNPGGCGWKEKTGGSRSDTLSVKESAVLSRDAKMQMKR